MAKAAARPRRPAPATKKVPAGKAPAKKAAPKAAPAKKAAPKWRPSRKPSRPAAPADEPKVFPVEVDAGSVEKTLAKVREELTHWVNKGRYTKVRFKLRGKPILPDLPVAAVIAAEAITFWWAGLLRALLVTLGANAVLEMELVNDADREVARGREAFLAGDLDRAMESFRAALEMDRANAPAHLSLGVAHKLRGELDQAREMLQRAEQLDPQGPVGDEARRLLDQMSPASAPAGRS